MDLLHIKKWRESPQMKIQQWLQFANNKLLQFCQHIILEGMVPILNLIKNVIGHLQLKINFLVFYAN